MRTLAIGAHHTGTGTGRTYGKLYGNEGSHESVIPKWYMFPNVPGVAISRY
jgi:hypothetical protein